MIDPRDYLRRQAQNTESSLDSSKRYYIQKSLVSIRLSERYLYTVAGHFCSTCNIGKHYRTDPSAA